MTSWSWSQLGACVKGFNWDMSLSSASPLAQESYHLRSLMSEHRNILPRQNKRLLLHRSTCQQSTDMWRMDWGGSWYCRHSDHKQTALRQVHLKMTEEVWIPLTWLSFQESHFEAIRFVIWLTPSLYFVKYNTWQAQLYSYLICSDHTEKANCEYGNWNLIAQETSGGVVKAAHDRIPMGSEVWMEMHPCYEGPLVQLHMQISQGQTKTLLFL